MNALTNGEDFDNPLHYAPPWARRAAPPQDQQQDLPQDHPPQDRPRQDPPPEAEPADELEWLRRRDDGFAGDVAVRELRARLALEPHGVPEPPEPAAGAVSWRMAARVLGLGAIVLAGGLAVPLLLGAGPKATLPVADRAEPAASSTTAEVTQVAVGKSDRAVPAAVAVLAPPPAAPSLAPEPPAVSAQPGAAAPAPDGSQGAPPAAAPLDPEELATLLQRGRDFIANGDIAAARLVLRRAAESGDAQAALLLGSTFDPAVLRPLRVIGLAPNPEEAHAWYRRAAEAGSTEAARRLDALARR